MSELKVEASKMNSVQEKRVATHSHITGLGLNEDGIAIANAAGFVGQTPAREAAGIIVDMVKDRKMAGRAVLIAGEPGSGKTAIALAMSHELGTKVPFCPMVGSQVYSAEVKKTEILMENFRRSIGVKIKEIKEVWEGEVVDMSPHEVPHPMSASGKAIGHVNITLKAQKGTQTIKMEPSVYEALMKAKISVGDIVYIESESGSVKRVGRSSAFRHQFDLEADEFVAIPKGTVHKKREVVQEVTLYDLDMANAQPTSGQDVVSLVGQMMNKKKTEITDKLRQEVNNIVNHHIEHGTAELIPGILFIDEAHMLDLDCFSWLNRALESPIAPIIVFATNRGHCSVRGSRGEKSSHGIPKELLDRLLIIRTLSYTKEEISEILQVRAVKEAIQLAPESIETLSDIALASSLRYVLQLLYPANIYAGADGRQIIMPEDIKQVSSLFLDTKRSAGLIENTMQV